MAEADTSKPTVYVETTVVSYLTARPARDVIVLGHQESTRLWWDQRSRYHLYISPFVLQEAGRGDVEAAAARLEALADIELLDVSAQVEALADDLFGALAIPDQARLDAFHLALGVYYEVDYVLTWNCAHLANATCARQLTDFVRGSDLWLPIICTPDEMIDPAAE